MHSQVLCLRKLNLWKALRWRFFSFFSLLLEEYFQDKDCVVPREVSWTDPRPGQELLRVLELTPEAVLLEEELYRPVRAPLLHRAHKPRARVVAEQPLDGEDQLLEHAGVKEEIRANHPVQLVLEVQEAQGDQAPGQGDHLKRKEYFLMSHL